MVYDLRPIALCNVVYMIMVKMVGNMMKGLHKVVASNSQSALLLGRLITDNILVAAELGHCLRRKCTTEVGWATLKLDMAKAYDKIEWSFLRKMLEKLGFTGRLVDLIMNYVTTVHYNILVNGKEAGTVVPSRGLRQGDCQSPYLFIICAEGLSILLQ
ncbi:secreted RxLR effector protein 78-like [Ipomoea triloba]|uniref:secreted RxLR effector protein 78-like n=1 Tax=Ipomoea triloba TaxID=35885 RepID=UPI00125D5B0D|nr:secreted RxLR effector protein 78-like [Ipomoea triloba]